MIAKLVVEGKEFDIEILDPKLQELIAPKKTGYEKMKINQKWYYVDADDSIGCVQSCVVTGEDRYKIANYYSDKTVAENNVRADKLMRQLRRFAVEHRVNKIDWDDEEQSKYYIWFDCDNLRVGSDVMFPEFGSIIFDSEKSCKQAIETFKDELIWYFTEYKDSM